MAEAEEQVDYNIDLGGLENLHAGAADANALDDGGFDVDGFATGGFDAGNLNIDATDFNVEAGDLDIEAGVNDNTLPANEVYKDDPQDGFFADEEIHVASKQRAEVHLGNDTDAQQDPVIESSEDQEIDFDIHDDDERSNFQPEHEAIINKAHASADDSLDPPADFQFDEATHASTNKIADPSPTFANVEDEIGYESDEEVGGKQEPSAQDGFIDSFQQELADESHSVNGADEPLTVAQNDLLGDGPSESQSRQSHQDGTEGEGETEQAEPEAQSVQTVSGIPDVEVVWNDDTYLLFGREEDDPDAYFLSDPSSLDCTLLDLLSRLRQVVQNEISPSHRLSIRAPQLNLEFNEKMHSGLLDRSFREIFECFHKLSANDGTESATMVLHLVAFHDCDQRFEDLLEAARQGKGLTEVADYASDQLEISQDDNEYDMHDSRDDSEDPDLAAGFRPDKDGSLEEDLQPDLDSSAAAVDYSGEQDALEDQDSGNVATGLNGQNFLDDEFAAQQTGQEEIFLEEQYQEITYDEFDQEDGQGLDLDGLADENSLQTIGVLNENGVVDLDDVGIQEPAGDADEGTNAPEEEGPAEVEEVKEEDFDLDLSIPAGGNAGFVEDDGNNQHGWESGATDDPQFVGHIDAVDGASYPANSNTGNVMGEDDDVEDVKNFSSVAHDEHESGYEATEEKVTHEQAAYQPVPTGFSNGTSATTTLDGDEHESYKDGGLQHQHDGEASVPPENDWETGNEDHGLQEAVGIPSGNSAKRSRPFDSNESMAAENDNKRRRT